MLGESAVKTTQVKLTPAGAAALPPCTGTSAALPNVQTVKLESLYEKRIEIYPRAKVGDSLGRFQRIRWLMVWITQLVFYGLPWLQWNQRPAVLFDLAQRKFFLFGLVLWPQDVIYLTGILVASALLLFVATAVAGRLWCGYACPQTVYTELFMWIERRIEGDRAARRALDRQPWSLRKIALKSSKHCAWGLLALWTGLTFVAYFTPITSLVTDIVSLQVGGWALFWVLFYGFATYGNAGWMREQVCKYMCPYARFQSAMFDRDTLTVTYDAQRGEPRGTGSRERQARGLGDCVDCGLCVQVCPTGIDIRQGLQYECIGCAACIDACNHVMKKASLPLGLIRYSSEAGMAARLNHWQLWRRVLRPRVLFYSSVLLLLTAGLVAALSLRVPLKVDVLRDRAALAREVTDEQGRAMVENVYRLNVMNTTERRQRYTLQASGVNGLALASEPTFELGAASTASVLVRLRVPADTAPAGAQRISIQVQAQDEAALQVTEHSTFLGPRR